MGGRFFPINLMSVKYSRNYLFFFFSLGIYKVGMIKKCYVRTVYRGRHDCRSQTLHVRKNRQQSSLCGRAKVKPFYFINFVLFSDCIRLAEGDTSSSSSLRCKVLQLAEHDISPMRSDKCSYTRNVVSYNVSQR